MYWYFSWKRGQHGSWWKRGCCWQRFPRWGKKMRLYQIFSMVVTISDTTTRTEICKLWWANQINLVINRTITSLEKELYLRMMDWLFIRNHDIKIWSIRGNYRRHKYVTKLKSVNFFSLSFLKQTTLRLPLVMRHWIPTMPLQLVSQETSWNYLSLEDAEPC